MPNFIHSMDAANIHILIKMILENNTDDHKNIPLYTIHDCFASTPNNIGTIEKLVKEAFLFMYFDNHYLKEMSTSITSQFKYLPRYQIKTINNKEVIIILRQVKGEMKEYIIPQLPENIND